MQQQPLAPAPHPAIQQQQQQQDSKSHQNPQSVQDHAEQVLHEQLLAAQLQSASSSHPAPPPPRPQPGAPAHLQPAPPGSRDHNNIDPAISGAPTGPPQTGMIQAPASASVPAQAEPAAGNGGPDMGGGPGDPHKLYGKRELSTSKRAAQNRAAQRAFRQRKEGYIRKLEEQVKEYEMLLENYKAIQAENYQLREYIISLQSRLIDSQNEVPELPSNIDLSQARPPMTGPPQSSVSNNPPATGPEGPVATGSQPEQMNALNRIAVAGLGMRKHHHEEAAFLGNNGNFPSKRLRSDGQNDQTTASYSAPPPTSGDSNQVTKTEAPQQQPSDLVS